MDRATAEARDLHVAEHIGRQFAVMLHRAGLALCRWLETDWIGKQNASE